MPVPAALAALLLKRGSLKMDERGTLIHASSGSPVDISGRVSEAPEGDPPMPDPLSSLPPNLQSHEDISDDEIVTVKPEAAPVEMKVEVKEEVMEATDEEVEKKKNATEMADEAVTAVAGVKVEGACSEECRGATTVRADVPLEGAENGAAAVSNGEADGEKPEVGRKAEMAVDSPMLPVAPSYNSDLVSQIERLHIEKMELNRTIVGPAAAATHKSPSKRKRKEAEPAKEQLRIASAENESSNEQLNASATEVELLRSQVDTAANETESLRTRVEASSVEVESLKSRLDDVTKEVASLKEERDEITRQNKSLIAQLADSAAELDLTKTRLDVAVKENAELKMEAEKESSERKNGVDARETANDVSLKEQLKAAMIVNLEMKEEILQLNMTLSNRGTDSEKRMKELEYEVEELRATLKAAAQEKDDLEEQLTERVNQLTQSVRAGELQMAMLDEEWLENQQLRQKLVVIETKNSQMADLENEKVLSLAERNKYEKLYSGTLARLDESNAMCETLSEQKALLESKLKELDSQIGEMVQNRPAPAPATVFLCPLGAAIKGLIEYYFSEVNLPTASELRKQMDTHGWVPVDWLMECRSINELTQDKNFIVETMQSSELVEVSVDGRLLRPRLNPEHWPFINSSLNVNAAEFVPHSGLEDRRLETSSSCVSSFLVAASSEQIWILGVLSDYVILLHSLMTTSAFNGKRMTSNKRPDFKLNSHRLLKFFHAGTPRPIIFQDSRLAKFAQFIDTKNTTFHGSLDAKELKNVVRLCSKPANTSFLADFGIDLSDVHYVADQIRVRHKDLTKVFNFIDGQN